MTRSHRRRPAHPLARILVVLALPPLAACAAAEGGDPERVVTLTEGTNMAASVSPDGETIVLALQGALWSLPSDGGRATRLTGPEMEATWPDWSPDGARIVFQNYNDNYYHLWTIAADGSDARQVTSGTFDHREPSWSPDGRRIAFASDRGGNGSYDIWTIDAQGGTYARRTEGAGEEHSPAWSPDGSRIAFAEGRFVRAVDEAGAVAAVDSIATGAVRLLSWLPDGRGVAYQGADRQIVLGGRTVTSGEDVFPFPLSWLPDGGFLYTGDGRIRVRSADGGGVRDVPFTAEVELRRPVVARHKDHRFDAAEPRPVTGIVFPVLSPDGRKVAFVALNDLWVMDIGSSPVRLTDDTFIEWIPSWSPDGSRIYFSSDRHGGGRPDLYAIDVGTRAVERISVTPDSRMIFPVLSPDGRSFAYIDGANQSLRVHDIASGRSRLVARQAYASNVGKPTWSPDGQTIALADIQRANGRFREGRNLIRTVDVRTGEWTFQEPAPLPDHLTERFESGPTWSPDGGWMAFVMKSTLHVIPVDAKGVPTGPARQLTQHPAETPSWSRDSRTILYMASGRMRTIGVDGTGDAEIPFDLTWTPAQPSGTTIIHAGGLWDGVRNELVRNVEIRLEGARIAQVQPIGPESRAAAEASGARFIDASELTVMPGMWDTHVHPRVQDFTGQWWAVQLAYGITSVLSNGVSPYHTLYARESLAAGRMIGPRLLAAATYDGHRPYYGHQRSVADTDVLQLELAKARELDMDFFKAYVRAPASYMRLISQAAQEAGVPSGSHYLAPAIESGLSGIAHLSASQRLGYSWTSSAGGKSYQDVIALFTQGDFNMTSTHGSGGVLGLDPSILTDPRLLELMPPDYVEEIVAEASTPPTESALQAVREDVAVPAAIMRGGGLVSIGTDTPLGVPALGVHGALRSLAYGVSNHEALQAVTINAARYSFADHELGTVEVGKIADLVLVRGDPLADVKNAANVELVMKNGIPLTIDQIREPYRR